MKTLIAMMIFGLATMGWAGHTAVAEQDPAQQERPGAADTRQAPPPAEAPATEAQRPAQQQETPPAHQHEPFGDERTQAGRDRAAAGDQHPTQHLSEAAQVFYAMAATPDQNIPADVLNKAKCVAVVPNMLQAGLVVGARHGNGVATCRDQQGEWSAPAFFTVTGATIGPQIGAQRVDLVMLAMTDEGRQQFMQREFELGAHASVAAGPAGAHAEATVTPRGRDDRRGIAEPERDPQAEQRDDEQRAERRDADILTYARTDGLFAGANIEGAYFRADEDSIQQVYGRDVGFENILRGEVDAPALAGVFTSAVEQAITGRDVQDMPAEDRIQEQPQPQRQPY